MTLKTADPHKDIIGKTVKKSSAPESFGDSYEVQFPRRNKAGESPGSDQGEKSRPLLSKLKGFAKRLSNSEPTEGERKLLGKIKDFLNDPQRKADASQAIRQLLEMQSGTDPNKAEPIVRQLLKDLKELSTATGQIDTFVKASKVDQSLRSLDEVAPGTIARITRLGDSFDRLAKTLPQDPNSRLSPLMHLLQTDAANFKAVSANYQAYAEARTRGDVGGTWTALQNLNKSLNSFQTEHKKEAAASGLDDILRVLGQALSKVNLPQAGVLR